MIEDYKNIFARGNVVIGRDKNIDSLLIEKDGRPIRYISEFSKKHPKLADKSLWFIYNYFCGKVGVR